MTRLAVFALTVAAALPACAQHTAGRGSFSGHSSPASHAAPALRSFAPRPAFRPSSGPPVGSSRALSFGDIRPLGRYGSAGSAARPSFYARGRFHPDRGLRFYPYPLVVQPGYWPAVNIDSFENYDAFDPDDPNNTPQPAAPADNYYYGSGSEDGQAPYGPYPSASPGEPQYQAGPAYPASPQYAPYAQPAPAPVHSQSPVQPEPASAETVTLIFNNGQPPEQIQNFLATRTTLTVIDGPHHRDIPMADLDLPATIKANRAAGVDLQLPGAR